MGLNTIIDGVPFIQYRALHLGRSRIGFFPGDRVRPRKLSAHFSLGIHRESSDSFAGFFRLKYFADETAVSTPLESAGDGHPYR